MIFVEGVLVLGNRLEPYFLQLEQMGFKLKKFVKEEDWVSEIKIEHVVMLIYKIVYICN